MPLRSAVRRARLAATLAIVLPAACASALGAQSEDLEVVRYGLTADLDLSQKGAWAPLNTMKATAAILVRNASAAPVTRIPFVLNRLLKADSARGRNGRTLVLSQHLAGLAGWESYQADVGEIVLDAPLQPGDTTTLVITYGGQLSDYRASGMLYVQDGLNPAFTILRAEAAAYPLLAEPDQDAVEYAFGRGDGFDQRLEVTVPEGLRVASGQELVSTRRGGGKVTYVYRSRAPLAQIILPIAAYRTLDVGPAHLYFFPEDSAGAARVADGIRRSLDLYTGWFGPLRDTASFAIAEIPELFGSQALRPTIIQESTAFKDASGMTELYHEISHLWNVDDTDPHPSRWNEGLAMYLQEVVQERIGDEPGRLQRKVDRDIGSLRTWLAAHPEAQAVPIDQAGVRGLTSVISYTAGEIFFALLDRRLGGDRLRALLDEYSRTRAVHGGGAADFASFMTGKAPEARPIFADWFTGGAYSALILQGMDLGALAARYAPNGTRGPASRISPG